MNPPKMPIHIGDYKRDTSHLRAAQHGAYLLLLFHYWSTGGLPDEDDQLAAIAAMTRAEWKRTRKILEPFFDDGWRHGRVEKDLAAARASYEKRAKAGEKGGKAKAEAKQSSSNATTMPEQPLTLDHIPETKEEKERAESAPAAQVAPPREKVSRGTRLPEDWQPTSEDSQFAATQGLRLIEIEIEAAKFKNYWTSKPGAAGRKLNWPRTWQNWILNAAPKGRGHERAQQNRGNTAAGPQQSQDAVITGMGRAFARRFGNESADRARDVPRSENPAEGVAADGGAAEGDRGSHGELVLLPAGNGGKA